MPPKTDWQIIEPLGSGGQSTVYKVRNPSRVQRRADDLKTIRMALDGDHRAELADAIWDFARPDIPSELAALKDFDKVRREGAEAEKRLSREIAVLKQGRPGLPKLLDSDESAKWIVTQFFPEGTLEKHHLRYRGQPARTLHAFRSLVTTVQSLHQDKIIHRDIKPANVFIGDDEGLILGDFGIVYLPDETTRMTRDGERVGPWDYMPQWADTGERLETVEPNFDVYMLGKLLWCMLSGKLRLPREYHRVPQYDLTKMFPKIKSMKLINSILDQCLCEQASHCLPSAEKLLQLVDETLEAIESDLPQSNEHGLLDLRCLACGRGTYQPMASGAYGNLQVSQFDAGGRQISPVLLKAFCCNVCTHYAFFAPGYPDEAEKRSWKPWKN